VKSHCLDRHRVVVIGDSLSLPRNAEADGEAISWEHTWPYQLERILLLKAIDVEVINCGSRARTVETLPDEAFCEHVILKRPGTLIIQIGIVDCAPRIFSRSDRQILALCVVPNWLREFVIRRRSSRRARLISRNPLAKVYVPPSHFLASLNRFEEQLSTIAGKPRVIFLPIVGDFEQLNARSPGFSSNISQYNRLLREFVSRSGFQWLEWRAEPHYFWRDGYHLNVAGNAALAMAVADKLSQFLVPKTISPAAQIE
jgi:acyl-CoA thioesterase I